MTKEPIEKITLENVEVINTQEHKEPKITKVKANESVADFMNKMNNATGGKAGGGIFENPLVKLMSDPVEMAKAKLGAILIFGSIIFGFIGLFGFREYMATSGLVLGILAYFFGADILQKGALFGIFLGLVGIVLMVL